jgi:hypothetical protein
MACRGRVTWPGGATLGFCDAVSMLVVTQARRQKHVSIGPLAYGRSVAVCFWSDAGQSAAGLCCISSFAAAA